MTELRSRAFTAIRVFLGLLLLSAAGLKIYGWSVSTVPPVGWFSAPNVQAAAIGWEILLGTWLLCGIAVFGSWLAAIGTFTLLAGISGYLGWIGQATCGCFGTIKASPWYAFAVDVAALTSLVVGKPGWQFLSTSQCGFWRIVYPAAYFVVVVGVIVACSVGVGAWVYGSPQAALARLRGESITVTPGYLEFGSGHPGDMREATAEVRNWTDRPVRLIGGTSDCSCVVTSSLPIKLKPGETHTILVRMQIRESQPGAFTRNVELWTDYDNQRKIRFRLGCRVE
jgi:hypothetical protein